jgi:hypothetical protein
MNEDRLLKFIDHLQVGFEDKSLIVLKGHLLLELALRDYIGKRVQAPERIEGVQINFASLIVFASALEDCQKHQWLWSALKKANTLRNQLAHNLEPKKINELESEFIDYVRTHDGEGSIEVDDIELKYGNLEMAFLQIFDTLIHAYPASIESEKPQRKSEERVGILKMFNLKLDA